MDRHTISHSGLAVEASAIRPRGEASGIEVVEHDDPDAIAREIAAEIRQSGQRVAHHLRLAAAGPRRFSHAIFLYAGLYWRWTSEDSAQGMTGPYREFEEAIDAALLALDPLTLEIACSTLTAPELANRIDAPNLSAGRTLEFMLNGEPWALTRRAGGELEVFRREDEDLLRTG